MASGRRSRWHDHWPIPLPGLDALRLATTTPEAPPRRKHNPDDRLTGGRNTSARPCVVVVCRGFRLVVPGNVRAPDLGGKPTARVAGDPSVLLVLSKREPVAASVSVPEGSWREDRVFQRSPVQPRAGRDPLSVVNAERPGEKPTQPGSRSGPAPGQHGLPKRALTLPHPLSTRLFPTSISRIDPWTDVWPLLGRSPSHARSRRTPRGSGGRGPTTLRKRPAGPGRSKPARIEASVRSRDGDGGLTEAERRPPGPGWTGRSSFENYASSPWGVRRAGRRPRP